MIILIEDFVKLGPGSWHKLIPPSVEPSGLHFVQQYISFQYLQYQENQQQKQRFLQSKWSLPPFIIGVTGSVASGKSTFATDLQKALQDFYPGKKIALVSTDGFLMANSELKAKNLMDQKGFPISFNWGALANFLKHVKMAQKPVPYRLYSQEISDLVPNKLGRVDHPDFLIIEGINLLEMPTKKCEPPSDYVDLSIYLDASEENLENWFMERFHRLLDINQNNPGNFYYEWANQPRSEVDKMALQVWQDVNLKNLREFIAPTRVRADMILEKKQDHSIADIYLSKRR